MDFPSPDYYFVWQLQKQLVEHRLEDAIPNTILVGEHDPVITIGRRSQLLSPSLCEGDDTENHDPDRRLREPVPADTNTGDIPMIEVERGGELTWHGPGQLVVYPIIKLTGTQRNLHGYLRLLEEVIIRTLAEFNIQGFRNEESTGVWVTPQPTLDNPYAQPRKIASVGVAVSRWVTYHGLSLNISNDLSVYQQFSPCGLPGTVMTSLTAALEQPVALDDVKASLLRNLIGQL